MGYTSNVCYQIAFKDRDTINKYIALVMAMGGERVKALKECDIERTPYGEYRINFYTTSVKWYESYPDVQAHMWLHEFAEERFPEDSSWVFVRVGEDIDDVECMYAENMTDWDLTQDIYPEVSIACPFRFSDGIGDKLGLIDPHPDESYTRTEIDE